MKRVWPFDTDEDFACRRVKGMEPALHQQSPLYTEGCDQEVEAHSTKAVAFQESHEKAESHKDHDVHVLEAWTDGGETPMGFYLTEASTQTQWNINGKKSRNLERQ